jgi:L-ascorbate metabolism protein UlaG (beta-lactamase superfamily)
MPSRARSQRPSDRPVEPNRVTAAGPPPHPTRIDLTWVGHATAVIDLDGTRVLTDPVLRGRVAHLVRRSAAPAGDAATADVLLLSHLHRDHFDLPSLRLLRRDLRVVVPRGAGRTLARLGFGDVHEIAEGEELDAGSLRIRATHAEHAAGRGFRSVGARPVGYVLHGSATVYFTGDTDLFPGMAELTPELDLALLPVSGWGPRVPAGHLDVVRAARALQLLRPRVCVPIHWGTFRPFYRTTPYPSDDEPGRRLRDLAQLLTPEIDVRVLEPGGWCTVEGAGAAPPLRPI